MQKLAARAGRFLWWRAYLAHWRWGRPLADRLSTRWGWPARLARWPLSWHVPYHRGEVHVSRLDALGDVLMCTPALRELKRRNSTCRVTFYTNFPLLLDGLPFIDQVRPMADEPADAIYLRYEESLPPRRHIEVGISPTNGSVKHGGNYLDLRGQTTLPDLVATIAAADLLGQSWQPKGLSSSPLSL
jgi:hypothetical protein